MRKVLIAATAVALLTGAAKADGPSSTVHGAAAPTLWACATHSTAYGTQVTKYRVEKDKLVNLSDIELLLGSRHQDGSPASDDLRQTVERQATYRILEDTSVGLIAIQAGAELSDNLPSVSAAVIMIDKKTGGFRSLIFAEERFDRFAQPKSDMDERGQCTIVAP
jgi:hypothetical protein